MADIIELGPAYGRSRAELLMGLHGYKGGALLLLLSVLLLLLLLLLLLF